MTSDDEFIDDFEDEIDVKSMHGEGGKSTEWMDQPKMKKAKDKI